MKNIVIATKENVAYYNLMVESCDKYGYDLVVLGMNQPWSGLSDKYKYWEEYLSGLPENELVMMNDAYDVVMLDPANVIVEKFRKFNKPVVCSVQKGMILNFVFPKHFDHVICTGNIIGYAGAILKIIRLVIKNKHLWNENSDQITFNRVCKVEPYMQENIGLDTDQTIFFVTSIDNFSFSNNLKDIDMRNKKLYNKNKENTKPNESISVLHLAVNMNGNTYLEYMGYDTSNSIVKGMGLYKLRQVWTYIKELFYNCTGYVLLVLGLFITIALVVRLKEIKKINTVN
jgi:hypothetical protein